MNLRRCQQQERSPCFSPFSSERAKWCTNVSHKTRGQRWRPRIPDPITEQLNCINYSCRVCWRYRFAIGETSKVRGNVARTSRGNRWVILAVRCFWFGSKTSSNTLKQPKHEEIMAQLVATRCFTQWGNRERMFFRRRNIPRQNTQQMFCPMFSTFPPSLTTATRYWRRLQ